MRPASVGQVPVLLIGRAGSRGVPGKNTMTILGRPLMAYPLLAAAHAATVGTVYLSTDGSEIKRIGRSFGAEVIDRPPELCTASALVEDVVVHGYEELRRREGRPVPIFVLLFCNSATVTPGLIDQGVRALQDDVALDSAVSVSLYNEYSPVRAKRIDDHGLLAPYVDVEQIPGASCDRDSATSAYFCDCSLWVLRDRCLRLGEGQPPFRWMGRRSMPLHQAGGLDIDHDYGVAMTEHWLRRHGFSEEESPYTLAAEARTS
jgi:Cytidylyltransferase